MSRNWNGRQLTLLLLLVALVLTVVACGGGAEEPVATAPTEAPTLVGDAVAGEAVYLGTCMACHGADARGVTGLGKTLHPADSDFIRSRSDAELVEYIIVGRTPDDPLNTTGVGMPARGGNPALSEQDLYDVVAYMRSLE